MLRCVALFALVFHLLAGALPVGTLVRVGSDGVAVAPLCCGMDDVAQAPRDSHTVHCCCYTGIVVGHQDLFLAQPISSDLPVIPATPMLWPSLCAARNDGPAIHSDRHVRDGPPSLGLAYVATIVIRC
ncbi:MAG: hypothetical protein H0V44_15150 [Planctomycetes bacterium]|nr:hypothetical protein [Planctomycetota bacterium]